MADRILLAVDLSYQTYRAAAAHQGLSSRRIFTGGLYGFFTTVSKMINDTQATELLICQDVKPYHRSIEYPEYKQLRKARADEELLRAYKESMELVLECLEGCGVGVWGIKGFESDDLIAHVVRKYRHRYTRIYAGSNDSDLFQLLDAPNFFVYRKSMADLVHSGHLIDPKGNAVTPRQYMLATALMGTHNDIAGIDGVGPVTAFAAARDPIKLRKVIEGHSEIVERNLRLIELPHRDFPRATRLPVNHRAFNPRALYKSLGYYDIDVTGAMMRAFDSIQGR